jgi:ribosomal protein S14
VPSYKAFIVSNNVKRRHMTASQRVMATALIYPEPANISKNATKISRQKQVTGSKPVFSKGRLSMARYCLRNKAVAALGLASPPLCPARHPPQ